MKAMISHSKKNIALMDTHKFNKVSKKIFMSPREVDLLITDASLDDITRNQITESGLSIYEP